MHPQECNLLTNIISKKQFAWKEYHCKVSAVLWAWFVPPLFICWKICLQSNEWYKRQVSLMWHHWALLSEEMKVVLLGTWVSSYEWMARGTAGLGLPSLFTLSHDDIVPSSSQTSFCPNCHGLRCDTRPLQVLAWWYLDFQYQELWTQ